jgi:predicted CoA-binding protein
MNHDSYPADYIRGILHSVKVIAMVGASATCAAFPSGDAVLLSKGYDVIPVNPGLAGQTRAKWPWKAEDIPRPSTLNLQNFKSCRGHCR